MQEMAEQDSIPQGIGQVLHCGVRPGYPGGTVTVGPSTVPVGPNTVEYNYLTTAQGECSIVPVPVDLNTLQYL